MKTVAIIGGGFSGSMLAANLLLQRNEPFRVLLFERTGVLGAGVAYATNEPQHLLNVPAAKMSAFHSRPNHFVDWLLSSGIDVGDGFVERSIYRRYLQDILHNVSLATISEFQVVTEEVIQLDGNRLITSSEKEFEADIVVLATGHLKNSTTPLHQLPWPEQEIKKATLYGSGLSAMDAAASIFARYPNARITCISRHGFLPETYDLNAKPYPLDPSDAPTTVRGLMRWLRQEIACAETKGFTWASIFDAMRPHWDQIWSKLPQRERCRYVNHVQRHFDRYRHRMPPSTAHFLRPFLASGALSIQKGSSLHHETDADLTINCTGHSTSWESANDPLIRDLVTTGRVRLNPLHLGIEADQCGRAGDRLYTLGPPLRGCRWETTAVPDIRVQIEVVANSILKDIHG